MVGVTGVGVLLLVLAAVEGASARAVPLFRAATNDSSSNDTDDDKPDPCKNYFPCFNMGKCVTKDLDYECQCYEDYFENKQDKKKKYCRYVKEKCKEQPCTNVNETCNNMWANNRYCYSLKVDFDPMYVLYDPNAIAGHPYFILMFHGVGYFGKAKLVYPTLGYIRFDTGEGTIMQYGLHDLLTHYQQLDNTGDFSGKAMYFHSTAARTFLHRKRIEKKNNWALLMLLFYTYHSKDENMNVTYIYNPGNNSDDFATTTSKVHVLEDQEECTPDVLMVGCSGHAAGFYGQNSTPILWDYREGHSFRPYIRQKCAKENSTLRIVWVTHNIPRNITTGYHEDFAVKGTRKRGRMDSFDLWQNAPVFFVPPKYEHAVIELLVYETIDAATVKKKISFYNSVQCQINTFPRVPITVVWGGVTRTHARGDPFVVDIRNSFMPWTDNPYYWPNNTELKHWMYWRICLEVPLREHQFNDSDDMEYLEKDLNKGCRKMHYVYQNFYNNNWHENYSNIVYHQTILSYYTDWFTVKGHYTYDLAKEWYQFTHYTMDDSVPGMNDDGNPRAELSPSLLSGNLMSKISVFNVSIRMYYSNVYTRKFKKAPTYIMMRENRGIRVKLIQGSGYPLLNIRCLRNCGMGGPWTPDTLQDKYKTLDGPSGDVVTRVLPNTGIGDDLMIDTTISSVLLVECIERCSDATKKGSFYKWEIFSRAEGRNGTLTPLAVNWKKNTSPQNSRVLSLDKNQLKTNKTYVFRVTPTDPKVKEAYTEFLTQIQGGIKTIGTCKIDPKKGITGVTEFEITCEKFEKNYVVSNLNYEFLQEQEDENGTKDSLLLEWTFHSAVKHIVLAGTGAKEHSNKIKVKVTDTFGNFHFANLDVKLEVMNKSKLKELATDTGKPLSLPLRADAEDVGGVARLSSALVDAINAAGANVTEDDKKKYFKYIVNAIAQINVPCIETVRQINGAMKKIARIAKTYADLEDGQKMMQVYAMIAKEINTYSRYYWSQVEKVKDEIINALEGLTPVLEAVVKLGYVEKEVGNETFDVYDDLKEIEDVYEAKDYSKSAYTVVTNLVVSKLNRMVEKEQVEKKASDYYFRVWVNWTGNNDKEHGDNVVKLSWDYKPKAETLLGFQIFRFPSDIFWWSSYFQNMQVNSHLLYIYLEKKDYHRSYGDPIKWLNTPSTFKFNITKKKVKIQNVKGNFIKYEDGASYATKIQIYRFYMKEGQHLLVNFTELGTEPVKVVFVQNTWPLESDFKKYFTIGSRKNLTAAQIAEADAANPEKDEDKKPKAKRELWRRREKKKKKKRQTGMGRRRRRRRRRGRRRRSRMVLSLSGDGANDSSSDEYSSDEASSTGDYEGDVESGGYEDEDARMARVDSSPLEGLRDEEMGLVYDADEFSESYDDHHQPPITSSGEGEGEDSRSSGEESGEGDSDAYLDDNYEMVDEELKDDEDGDEDEEAEEEEAEDEKWRGGGGDDDNDEAYGDGQRMDRKDELDSEYIIKYKNTPTVENDTWVYMGILPFAKELDKLTLFSFKALSSSCQEWLGDRWSLKRCHFNLTTSTPWFIECNCPNTYFRIHSAASYTAKGAFFIPPEESDVLSSGPRQTEEFQVHVYMVLLIMLLLFIALFIWAAFRDMDDKKKRRLIVLPDNSMAHSYGYLLTVYTGCQKDAGTSAKIGIQLFGSMGNSERHLLHSDSTEVLQDGSTDWFMLYTSHSLGDLLKIHVWSNCRGHRQAWYCSHIVVRDIQLQKAWTFMVQRWVSLVRGEGMISFRLRPTPKAEIFKKHRVFIRNMLHYGAEGHMWFNILTYHPRSFYSRKERVLVCAFGAFFNVFLIVALYPAFIPSTDTIVLRIANLSPRHFLLALLCTLGCLLSTFILSFLFRKSTPFSLRLHRVKTQKVTITSAEKYSYFDVEKTQRMEKGRGRLRTTLLYLLPTDPLCESHRPFEERIAMTSVARETCHDQKHMDYEKQTTTKRQQQRQPPPPPKKVKKKKIIGRKKQEDEEDDDEDDEEKKKDKEEDKEKKKKKKGQKKKKKKNKWEVKKRKKVLHYHTNHFFMPKTVRYVAWVLVIVGIVCFIGVSILLSLGREELNRMEWLTSVLLMVSFSILIVEPIKVFITALVATYIVQVEPMDLDMERGYPLLPELGTLQTENVLRLRRALQDYAPVTTWYIPELRAREKARLSYYTKSFEIVCVTLFAIVVLCSTFLYIEERRALFLHEDHLRDMFIRGGNASMALKDVRIVKDIYDYIDKTFIPLFLEIKNSSDPNDLLYDDANKMIGQPRMRQLRVKKGTTCPGLPAQDYLSCFYQFSMDTMDRQKYYMGWSEINPPPEKYSERAREQYWMYLDHTQTKSIPVRGENYVYPGGGYIAVLGRYITNMNLTLQYLKRNEWLNDFTSFVALELLLYNMNNGYLSFVSVVFEKDITGYLLINTKVRTVNLVKNPVTKLLVMELLFGLVICGVVYYQLLALQVNPVRSHFQDWWSVFDILLAFTSVASLSLYLIRRSKEIQMLYRLDRHEQNQYLSLVEMYVVEEMFVKCLALLVLVATVRVAKACMNLWCFRKVEATLFVEALALIFITFYSLIVLLACSVAAFLSLGYRLHPFRTPVSGLGTVTASLFGVHQSAFSLYEAWFVQMLFGFIVAMSIIIVNMYRAVLLEAYTKAKARRQVLKYGYCDFFREEATYHCKCRRRARKMKTGRLRGGGADGDGDDDDDDPEEKEMEKEKEKETRAIGPLLSLLKTKMQHTTQALQQCPTPLALNMKSPPI